MWILPDAGRSLTSSGTRARVGRRRGELRIGSRLLCLVFLAMVFVEAHVDDLESLVALPLRIACVRTSVTFGEVDVVGERGEQGAGVEPPDPDDIHLRGQYRHDRGDVQHGDEPK